MLSTFRTSYARLETSLQTLTDSIAAYNPSTAAAEDLVAADDVVNGDLEVLLTHQSNHRRIVELRATAQELDERIKLVVTMLADMRKEVQAIPASAVSGDKNEKRDVDVDELLSYAKFISKTTVPPTFRGPRAPQSKATEPNGDATTAAAHTPVTANNAALAALPTDEKNWLDVAGMLSFEPWPSHEVISRGALAELQHMLERGEDPALVLSKEEREEKERREREEAEQEEEAQRERERRRREMFDTGRRETVVEETAFNPDDL